MTITQRRFMLSPSILPLILFFLTISVSAITPDKKFYPKFRQFFRSAYEPCYNDHGAAFASNSSVCLDLVNCILENITEERKASIASTGVFLGFIPTVLTFLGPSIKDIALLSTERPILALLCAVGTTGFGFSKPFLLLNVRRTMQKFQNEQAQSDEQAHSDLQDRYFSPMMSKKLKIILIVLQYLLCCGAVGNTLHNSYEIGTQTSLAWNCRLTPQLPLTYSMFSLVSYILINIALKWGLTYYWRLKYYWSLRYLEGTELSSEPSMEPSEEEDKRNLFEADPKIAGFRASIRARLKREFILSYAAIPTRYNLEEKELKSSVILPSIILGWLADCMVLAQYIMGTVILSNSLFVRLDDAVWIALRYIVSAMACRFIVAFELEGMKQAFRIEAEENKRNTTMKKVVKIFTGKRVTGIQPIDMRV